jgi:arginine utilization regulatory protein
MEIFMNYDWPGNVRELQHTIEGIASLFDVDIIREEHLPFQFKTKRKINDSISLDEIGSLSEILDKTEQKIIRAALESTEHNISKAAEILNIPRQTLQYRIKKLGL